MVMAIDAVCNLFTEYEVSNGQTGLDEHFLEQIRFPTEWRKGVSIENYIGMKDRAGIDRSLLIAVRAGDQAGIDPYRGMDGVRELEHAVRELGFVGAHLYPHWIELAPDHAKYYPYYAKCCELDIPIMMQVGHNLVYSRERRLPSVGRPITLDQVAIDFPELKLIGIHIGIPWTDEMISMAWKHENVYIGSDAYAPKYWPDSFVHYLKTYGQDKVLFGTDWPVISPERAMDEIKQLGISEPVMEKFLHTNAKRIFKL